MNVNNNPPLTIVGIDFAYRFENEKYQRKDSYVSNLVLLMEIGDLLHLMPVSYIYNWCYLSRQRIKCYVNFIMFLSGS